MQLVSVIIPAFNALRWLPETLQSVAAQDYSPVEIVIVDDGSTDGTESYIQTEWPQAKYVRTENRGVSHARNLGARLATGELIQYLDADDLLLPGKLSRQVALLSKHSEVDVVYSDWQRWVNCGEGAFERGEIVSRKIADVNEDPEIAFFTEMWCPTSCYLYRHQFLKRVGDWKSWLPVIQDARFALDCAMAGARWLHDPVVSVLYRQHRDGSVSTRSRIAFLNDCLKNAEEVEKLWAMPEHSTTARRAALLQGYANLARSFYDLDRQTFGRLHRKLLDLNPRFVPSGRVLGALAKLIGYPQAEHLASLYRRLKSLV